MIKNFFDKLMGKPAKVKTATFDQTQITSAATAKPPAEIEPVKALFGQRREYGFADHGINVKLVDDRALDVVRTLKNGGFEAFIVGGAVRDLLVGLVPKDFDVATNATPEQVKSLFRRAFIIGRRFRIVHVVYGRGREHEVIEVSTFRAHLDSALAEQVGGNERTSKTALAGMTHAVDSAGRVLRDNVWGSMEHDAARRDFTINAMYYDPQSQTVVDWHGGMADSKHKIIRMIGEPAARYREDPVRIIRAVRFAAKLAALGFTFEPGTSAPLARMKSLLADVPQSRLFDEMLKLLQTGHSIASIAQLKSLGLARGIYPLLDVVVEREAEPFLLLALQDTDRRVGEGKPVAPSFLIAALLWADVRSAWQQRMAGGQHALPALHDSIDEAFNARIGDVSGRGKLGIDVREIWTMQTRFDKRSGSAPYSLIEQPRFRAGFDFLRLRAQCGETDVQLAEWWEKFSTAYDDERHAMVEALRLAAQPQRKAGRAPARVAQSALLPAMPAQPADTDATVSESPDSAFANDNASPAAPARRKRTRRSAAAKSLATEPETGVVGNAIHPAIGGEGLGSKKVQSSVLNSDYSQSSGPSEEEMDIAFGMASPAAAALPIGEQADTAPKKRRRRSNSSSQNNPSEAGAAGSSSKASAHVAAVQPGLPDAAA